MQMSRGTRYARLWVLARDNPTLSFIPTLSLSFSPLVNELAWVDFSDLIADNEASGWEGFEKTLLPESRRKLRRMVEQF